MKNDVSFIILCAMTMGFWEHQSSFNPNLPIRLFIYAAHVCEKYVTSGKFRRFSSKLQRLPKPKCICFYNGTDDQPEERVLKLSDAYDSDDGDIEVRVRMLNINYGRNRALMEACNPIMEYGNMRGLSRLLGQTRILWAAWRGQWILRLPICRRILH